MEDILGKLNPNKKIVARNYGTISHLKGSKMINSRDKLIGINQEIMLTEKIRDRGDLIIITEKIDGCNVGVFRCNNKLYPLVRKGYDVRTNPVSWIKSFANYVEDRAEQFFDLLQDQKRVCGEWMIHQHTLKYKLKGDPFIAFDIIRGIIENDILTCVKDLIKSIEHTGLVHIGSPMPPDIAMILLGKGFHGVEDDQPEGIVYRYESAKYGFEFSAKFVDNHKLGINEYFKVDDPYAWNEFKNRYRKYCILNV